MKVPEKKPVTTEGRYDIDRIHGVSDKVYPDISGITDQLLIEADYLLSPDDDNRLRSVISGDPIGDYVGFHDLQELMIVYEHAAARLAKAALQQID